MRSFYDTLCIREDRCREGCSTCEEACLQPLPGEERRACPSIKVVHLPERQFHSAVVCNQCADPACAACCPSGAVSRSEEDGVVRIDREQCLGCGLCVLACPYGGVDYDPISATASKCDVCNGAPKCAQACPEGAIELLRSREVVEHLHADVFRKGSPLCMGCPAELALRLTMRVMGKDTFLFGAPGCAVLMICGMGTQTYSLVPSHMSNMTNLPSTAAGLKRYYRKKGRDVRCVCFAGDGCFADVGFQPLSGAAERGENIIVICYDNEGFMNTGIQRSGTTPYLSWTSTTPVGKAKRGKHVPSKNMPLIMADHEIPYVATATIGYPEDYIRKLRKAMTVTDGMSYIHLLSPCPTGWKTETNRSIDLSRLAVETNYFPLWECEGGSYRFTQQARKARPAADFLKSMGRFKHLTDEEVETFQGIVDKRFARIQALTGLQEGEGET
jgi:phenylglyoxylate dehydrogenase beta subunit